MNFFGTTSPTTVLSSVTSGVQHTGINLWPLLVLIGIPIAFYIGTLVVVFIRKSVGYRNSEGYTLEEEKGIAHKAWLDRTNAELEEKGMTRL